METPKEEYDELCKTDTERYKHRMKILGLHAEIWILFLALVVPVIDIAALPIMLFLGGVAALIYALRLSRMPAGTDEIHENEPGVPEFSGSGVNGGVTGNMTGAVPTDHAVRTQPQQNYPAAKPAA